MAVCATSAMAESASADYGQSSYLGNSGYGKGVDMVGQGIFQCGGSAFQTPAKADTNFDSIDIGNDWASVVGLNIAAPGPFTGTAQSVQALNDLKIKKNQDSGDCACCQALSSSCPCQDCCTKYNIEDIKVGNRAASAVGLNLGVQGPFSAAGQGTVAHNNVEIITNQD